MNRNYTLWFLITVVLSIWGIIGYKVVAAFNQEEKPLSTMVSSPNKNLLDFKKNPEFDLTLPERDPFFGKLYQKKTPKKVPSSKKKQPKKEVIWPDIRYQGLVSDAKNSKQVFLIDVNSTPFFVEKGQLFSDNLKLIKGDKETVVVSMKNQEDKWEKNQTKSFDIENYETSY